jgi:hypothetical protein
MGLASVGAVGKGTLTEGKSPTTAMLPRCWIVSSHQMAQRALAKSKFQPVRKRIQLRSRWRIGAQLRAGSEREGPQHRGGREQGQALAMGLLMAKGPGIIAKSSHVTGGPKKFTEGRSKKLRR